MIPVFHIFLKSATVTKTGYTPEFRKSFLDWGSSVRSELGYIENNRLILPDYWKDQVPPVVRTGGIVLQDILGYSGRERQRELELEVRRRFLPEWYLRSQMEHNRELYCFNKQNRKWPLGMLSIEKSEEGTFDLFVDFLENPYLIYESPRVHYRIGTLKKAESIEIRANGKSDFTMTGRKQRTYYEVRYIIQYLGDVQGIDFRPFKGITIDREIPETFFRQIDLRKKYY